MSPRPAIVLAAAVLLPSACGSPQPARAERRELPSQIVTTTSRLPDQPQVRRVDVPTTLVPPELDIDGITVTQIPQTCTLSIEARSDTIGFDRDSATIGAAGLPRIAAIARLVDGAAIVRVDGHTSSEGDRTYNVNLSRRRADAVVHALLPLVAHVIAFTAVGRGPDQPVADNANEAGRAANRRVTITAQFNSRRCA